MYQCCRFRFSTLITLLDFHKGPTHLSDALRQSLASDAAQPVLLEAHFAALDRRVAIVLQTVHRCVERFGYSHVIVNDSF